MEIVAINNKAVRHFKTVWECAEFLKTTEEKVMDAIENHKHISGWFMTEDKRDKSPMIFGARTMADGARYNPIFTRKPYSSTGIWRRFENER